MLKLKNSHINKFNFTRLIFICLLTLTVSYYILNLHYICLLLTLTTALSSIPTASFSIYDFVLYNLLIIIIRQIYVNKNLIILKILCNRNWCNPIKKHAIKLTIISICKNSISYISTHWWLSCIFHPSQIIHTHSWCVLLSVLFDFTLLSRPVLITYMFNESTTIESTIKSMDLMSVSLYCLLILLSCSTPLLLCCSPSFHLLPPLLSRTFCTTARINL